MSEPQHPYETDMNADRPAPGGTPPAAAQAAPDSLAAVGARLAQMRESKGWSIEDVSARLKVSVPKLRALEAGDVSRLPDTTFALGVLRSYAKMLGADPAPFTQVLRRERGLPQPDLSMPASAGTDLPRGRVSLSLGGSGASRRKSWLWGVAAVIVGVIALAMWHTNNGESSAWLARLKATANGAAAQSEPASATVAEGQAVEGTTGASAPQGDEQPAAAGDQPTAQSGDQAAAQAGGDGAAQTAQVQAAPASASPAVVAQAPATASAAAAAHEQPAASAPAVAAEQQTAATDADTSTFAIRVTQDTWVNVRQKDGKVVFQGLIHGSDAREITGVAPLRVTVGNKVGIESMTLDGQPVDTAKYAAARGNVARFVLP